MATHNYLRRTADSSDRTAIEFPNQEAMDKYLKEHPGADRANHSVKKPEPAKAPGGESTGEPVKKPESITAPVPAKGHKRSAEEYLLQADKLSEEGKHDKATFNYLDAAYHYGTHGDKGAMKEAQKNAEEAASKHFSQNPNHPKQAAGITALAQHLEKQADQISTGVKWEDAAIAYMAAASKWRKGREGGSEERADSLARHGAELWDHAKRSKRSFPKRHEEQAELDSANNFAETYFHNHKESARIVARFKKTL